MTLDQVIKNLSADIKRAGTMQKWSEEKEISQSYVSNVVAGRSPPGPSILEALGLEKVTTYQRVK